MITISIVIKTFDADPIQLVNELEKLDRNQKSIFPSCPDRHFGGERGKMDCPRS